MSRKGLLVWAVVIVAAAFLFGRNLLGGRFDAGKIAAAERSMWQAYYSGDKVSLGRALVVLLREQFGLSTQDAMEVGKSLAEAAMTFHSLGGDYASRVLPPLQRAYTRLNSATGGGWDPDEAARAELEWWVARRTPGGDSAEEVGAAIAELYETLYGAINSDIEEAGRLRAQAAELRDRGGANADWAEVERLLKESYEALNRGITE